MHASSARRRILGAVIAFVAIVLALVWFLRSGEPVAPPALPVATENSIPPAPTREANPLLAPRESDVAERTVEPEPIDATSPSNTPTAAGVLAGRVAFADGSVPPPILLRLERWENERGARAAAASVVKATGCRSEIYVTTDDDGRFEVSGLCPGQYRASCARPETLWADGLFEPPTRDALYVLPGYLLLARAVDSNRAPVADVHLRVECREDPDASRRDPRTYVLTKVTDADGVAWIPMGKAGDALIQVVGLGQESPIDVVSLRLTPGVVRRDIWVPIAPGRADLRIRFTACSDGSFRVRKFRIHLTPTGAPAAQSGILLNLSADSTADDTVFRSLPPGRYLAKLLDIVMGMEPAYFFEGPDAQWTIELEDGRETLLSKCLRVGGHLRVLVQDACPTPHESPASAQFELLDASGKDRVAFVSFREPLEDGYRSDSALPVGIERYCDRVFESGDHTLRMRSKGHADQLVRVTVKAGEATPLVVRLEPEK